MLKRLYIHNFRCLENFELDLSNMRSGLLIGHNGSGKSTVAIALSVLQNIGRGINAVSQLVQTKDFARGRSDVPIRFEIEVLLDKTVYQYSLAFELPNHARQLQILEERLLVSNALIYARQGAEVTIHDYAQNPTAKLMIDWHLIALPILQKQSDNDPLHVFKAWLAHMIILAPIPMLMEGQCSSETLTPERSGANFGAWFSGLLTRYPAAYVQIDQYLRTTMPDIKDFQNDLIGKDFKMMSVRFQDHEAAMRVSFGDLSDGEKCFFLCAVVLAANHSYGPLFCFWDEPDNYLSLSEVGHFLVALRQGFEAGGQFLATSHNAEAIRKFSNENTLVLHRNSHLEPTLVRRLSDLSVNGDLIDTLIRGDIKA